MIKKSALQAYAKKVKGDTDFTSRKIIARIAGVTFDGRQEKIASIKPETKIKLERDRRNEYDFYAVKVLALLDGQWEHVGFLPKTMSRRVSKSLDDGIPLLVGVQKVKGGFETEFDGKANYGLDVWIEGQLL